jgi:assimilatory nitrate reductase catalytic subunit
MFNIKMFVCLCHGVTERDVQEAIDAGASTVEEIGYCTRAGTRCGTCVPVIADMVDGTPGQVGAREKPCSARLRVLITAA